MTQERNIGRYQILEDIAAGAQGSVYQAYDPETSQIVAVKVLHPQLAQDTDYLERFRREATASISIDHPNVVKIFEVGRDGDQYFMSMEYLPQNLARIIGTGRQLDIAQVVQLGIQICEGLAAAHSKTIVHRDLKPQNILIGTGGEAKVTDFGVARVAQLTNMTATGAVMGTPLYMSPEAVKGETVDRRADIYSLGCMLYEMLSGKVPFDGDSPFTVMQKHTQSDPPSLSRLRKDAPSELVKTIEHSMEKDPRKRFQNARDLSEALKQIAVAFPSREGGSFDAKSLPLDRLTDTFMDRYAKSWRKANRKRWAWLGTAFSVLAALVVLGVRLGAWGDLQERYGIQLPWEQRATEVVQNPMLEIDINATVQARVETVRERVDAATPPNPFGTAIAESVNIQPTSTSPLNPFGTAVAEMNSAQPTSTSIPSLISVPQYTPEPKPTSTQPAAPANTVTPTPQAQPTATYTPIPTPPIPTFTPIPTSLLPTPTQTFTPSSTPTSTPTPVFTTYVSTPTQSIVIPANLLITVDGNDWNMPTKTIMVNEEVPVSYTNMPTGNGEWIGLFKPDAKYAQFKSYKPLISSSGSFNIKMQPIAGQYELRMYDNANKLLLKSPLMTISPPPTQTPTPTATFTPSPTPINPDDLGGGPILINQPMTAKIDFHKDTDDWTFSGNKGQIVTITMKSNSEVDPFIRLIAPSGAEETWEDDYMGTTDAQVNEWPLQETGTYIIRVQSSKATFEDPTKIGTYVITLNLPP